MLPEALLSNVSVEPFTAVTRPPVLFAPSGLSPSLKEIKSPGRTSKWSQPAM